MLIVMGILAVLIVLLLAMIMSFLTASYVKHKREFTKEGFPTPPYRLEKDSKAILTGWVKARFRRNCSLKRRVLICRAFRK